MAILLDPVYARPRKLTSAIRASVEGIFGIPSEWIHGGMVRIQLGIEPTAPARGALDVVR